MRILLSMAIAIFAFMPCFAQDEDAVKSLLKEGVALHDKGDYEGALKVYNEILKTNSNHFTTLYEKSTTLYAMQRFDDCIELCQEILKKHSDNPECRLVYVNYGSALDGLNKPEKAVKVYSEGIKKFPQAYILYFNRGITQYVQKEYEKAVEDFKKSAALNPVHASSHQFLAYSIYKTNKVAAIMSLSTFLLLEREGSRAAKNLKGMLQLLGSNVEKTGDKNVTITLTPQALDTKEKGEDDFHLTEFMLTMDAALDHDEKRKDLDAAQRLKGKLELIVTHDAELKRKNRKGFFTTFYLPFLQEMKNKDLLETAAYIMYSSSDDEAVRTWLQANQAKMDAFYEWMKDYKWVKE